MSLKTEGKHAGEFIVSEANGSRSRETVTLLSGQNLTAGAPLARQFAGTAVSAALGANTGNGVMGAVTVSAAAMAGDYVVTLVEPNTNLGSFMVQDPLGAAIGHGVVGTIFTAGGISFTLADGATDFVSGDQFKLTVTATSVKYLAVAPAATDGSQIAVALLYDNVDATAGDKSAVIIARGAEVNANDLNYGAASAPQILVINAQLLAQGIHVRAAA